jgi:predicted permease
VSRARTFLAQLGALFRSSAIDRELQLEIASHLEEATEELLKQGLTPEAARREAFRRFGGVAQAEDAYRQRLSFRWLDRSRSDLRQTTRALRRNPGFAAAVLAVLAIGTGAIVSVFALLNAIVFRPLPYPQSDRLVVVKHNAPGLNVTEAGLSSGLYFHYSEHARSFDSFALHFDALQNLQLPNTARERVHITFAGVELFDVLRARPALGRLFTKEDAKPGFMNMTWKIPVLLSHEIWATHFGADPNIVGRTLTINDSPREVVGVMPEGFRFPDAATQIWILFEPSRSTPSFARSLTYSAVGRLKPGVTVQAAQDDLTRILPRIVGVYEDATPQRFGEIQLAPIVVPLKTAVIGDVRRVLWTLFAGLSLLLLIACASAAGLFLTRAEHRRREIALRFALGADARHVARVFLTEALVLTVTAAAIGLPLAKLLLWAVLTFTPVELPRAAEISIDSTSMVFAFVLAVLMAMFYGAIPLRQRRRTGRHPIVVLQVALALALMVGSALMLQTYLRLTQQPLGFSADRLLTMEIGLPTREYRRHARIYADVVDRVRQIPGVKAATSASFLPLTDNAFVFPVEADRAPVAFKFFVPGYFQAMHVPIVQGESFAAGEHVTSPSPVLVSAVLARRLYPAESAMGRPVRRLNRDGTPVIRDGLVPPFTIVGVVGDVRETTLRGDPSEVVYIPIVEPNVEQEIVPTNMTLAIRTDDAPLALMAAVRDAVLAVAPALTISKVRTMDAIVRAARSREAFVGALLLLAAVVSLFLGVVGIYGSVAHLARQRTREIGIRTALGAPRASVIHLVVAGSMRAVLVGASMGLAVALAGTRALGALLFGVPARDPTIFLAATVLLLFAALAAALLAARHALRVTPLVAMRTE